MICGPVSCGCSFQSVSLQMSGSGAPGDPLSIETMGPGIVATSASVTTPFLGQTIYETATGRFKVYDGTNWVIFGGKWPSVSVNRITNLSISDITTVDLTFPVEVYDTDGFHSASSHQLVIPTGLGGKYNLAANLGYAANANGYRLLSAGVSANAATPNELAALRGGGSGMQVINTGNVATQLAKDLVLEAGATLTFTTYQNSGGALNLTSAFATLRMVEHLPALT